MRAVFLGLLRHQTDILDRAARRRIERAGFLEIFDGLVIDRRIGIVGDHAVRIRFLPVRTPALATGPDQGRHRRVDDNIGRHVQVGDPLVRVHHVKRRTRGIGGVDVRLDLGRLVGRQLRDLGFQVTDAEVRIDA